jgi:hypothetical protein
MNFLKEIREHLKDFETEAEAEIHKFIDFLETRYVTPGPAVVAPPVASVAPPSTFTAPMVAPAVCPAPVTIEATSASATVPTIIQATPTCVAPQGE